MLQAIDDPPLTQQGIQQAHELGLRLKVPCFQVFSTETRASCAHCQHCDLAG